MPRIKDKDLKKSDIVPLIAKAGFTDVSAQYPDRALALQDLDGNTIFYPDFAAAREHLILQWLIQQNS